MADDDPDLSLWVSSLPGYAFPRNGVFSLQDFLPVPGADGGGLGLGLLDPGDRPAFDLENLSQGRGFQFFGPTAAPGTSTPTPTRTTTPRRCGCRTRPTSRTAPANTSTGCATSSSPTRRSTGS